MLLMTAVSYARVSIQDKAQLNKNQLRTFAKRSAERPPF